MKNLTLIASIVFLFVSCDNTEKNTVIQYESSQQPANNIRHHLTRVAEEITSQSLDNIKTKEDWEDLRSIKLDRMRKMISLIDVPFEGERPPLNTEITGTVHKEGYRIEKLFYESLPGLYVVANLYVPENIKEPRPAIIYLCGHSRTQKVHYQEHPRKFAQLGFVCLIVETIQYGEVFGEHWGCYANGWFHWYSKGYTPAGVEVWNAIRGLDLLEKRLEVDPENIGVTGISGGGAIAWFMAAVEPRIKAVAPVCGASTLEAQITTRTIDGHCDCMMYINTGLWDIPELGALIAPRPLLIAQADRDGLNKVESVRKIHERIRSFYELYEVPENVGYIETPGGHSYHENSREMIFSFFMKHLMGKEISPVEAGDVNQSPAIQLSADELKVYVDGPPADDRTKAIQESFIKTATLPDITERDELIKHSKLVKTFLKENTFNGFPDDPPPFDSVLVFRTLDRAPFGSRIYSFNTEKDWRLKIDIRYMNPGSEKHPLMIVLRNSGEKRWASEAFISGLNDNWNIAYLEVRGIGEFGWAPELQWHVRRASAWTGRTIASMQVYDVLRALEFCRTLEIADPDQLGIAARDDMAVVALYSALMDGNCKSVIVENPPETQNQPSRPDGRGPAIEMLNCLRITDVNQLPALLYPTEVTFIGKMPGSYRWNNTVLESSGIPKIRIVDDLENY